jgi:hypothetical protein
MVMNVLPAKILDTYIQENISPLMKTNGFLKNGKTWTKQNSDVTYVVNIQSNKWNVSGKPVEVFINYGIYSPERYMKQFKSSPLPRHPKEYDCYIRERLINSNDSSETWTISIDKQGSNQDVMLDAINSTIFPFFETH